MYARPELPADVDARLRDGDEPTPDAYGRVTERRRYEPVPPVAEALIAALESDGAVIDRKAPPPEELARTQRDIVRTVRTTTAAGIRLSFFFTAFPGVILDVDGEQSAYPFCGCDACDQSALDAIEELEAAVLPHLS